MKFNNQLSRELTLNSKLVQRFYRFIEISNQFSICVQNIARKMSEAEQQHPQPQQQPLPLPQRRQLRNGYKPHIELFKLLIIPLCTMAILICLKNMSMSYVFAERAIESQHKNDSIQLTEEQFRNSSQYLAEAVVNINAMFTGLHAIGLYAVIESDVCILWVFSTLETLADILVVIYWTGGFYPLVLPDMTLLTLYFFLISLFSWVFTLSLI